MICGVVSGVISSAIANPTDVLKVRTMYAVWFEEKMAFGLDLGSDWHSCPAAVKA